MSLGDARRSNLKGSASRLLAGPAGARWRYPGPHGLGGLAGVERRSRPSPMGRGGAERRAARRRAQTASELVATQQDGEPMSAGISQECSGRKDASVVTGHMV